MTLREEQIFVDEASRALSKDQVEKIEPLITEAVRISFGDEEVRKAIGLDEDPKPGELTGKLLGALTGWIVYERMLNLPDPSVESCVESLLRAQIWLPATSPEMRRMRFELVERLLPGIIRALDVVMKNRT